VHCRVKQRSEERARHLQASRPLVIVQHDEGRTIGAPSFNPRIRPHRLDDDLILFDEAEGRLFVLNATASFVWDRLIGGSGPEDVAAELAARAGVEPAQASRDVGQLLEQWRQAGIVGCGDPAARMPATVRRDGGAAESGRVPRSRGRFSARRSLTRRSYRLLDFGFEVAADPGLLELLDGLLGHLSAERVASRRSTVLEITQERDDWVLNLGGESLGRCQSREGIVPMVHAALLVMAYRESDCLTAIHAAAVSRGGNCVLLPGASGSGKSTLTAALVAKGYGYCTDDLCVLTHDPVRLRPAPVRVGLKPGSWPVLEGMIPNLATLPSYLRADGKRVRYWLPPSREGWTMTGFDPWSAGCGACHATSCDTTI
jgi:hypothetical protein